MRLVRQIRTVNLTTMNCYLAQNGFIQQDRWSYEILLDRKDNKRSKLVFCHFRGEIDIICQRCKEAGMDTASFDGRTPRDERERLLQSSCDVLVLQIQNCLRRP